MILVAGVVSLGLVAGGAALVGAAWYDQTDGDGAAGAGLLTPTAMAWLGAALLLVALAIVAWMGVTYRWLWSRR